MFEIEIHDLLFEKLIVFSHKKICTLISWLFSPTFGVQIIEMLGVFYLNLIFRFISNIKMQWHSPFLNGEDE